MPEFAFYSVSSEVLAPFVKAIDKMRDEDDKTAWAAFVRWLDAAAYSRPTLLMSQGRPVVSSWLQRPARLMDSSGLPDLSSDTIPPRDSASLSCLLKKLTLMSASHTLQGVSAKFNGFYTTDLPDKAVFKGASWREEYRLFLNMVFRSNRPFPPELEFLGPSSGFCWRSYLAPDEVQRLLEAEAQFGMFRSLRAHYLATGDRWLASDFGRLIPFLALLREEGLSVYYQEYGT